MIDDDPVASMHAIQKAAEAKMGRKINVKYLNWQIKFLVNITNF